jgi:hypothetical protein
MRYQARVEVSKGTGKNRIGWGCTDTVKAKNRQEAKIKLHDIYQTKYPDCEIRVYMRRTA